VASKALSPVKVTIGLRQRDALSPKLFNSVLKKVIRKINVNGDLVLGNSSIQFRSSSARWDAPD